MIAAKSILAGIEDDILDQIQDYRRRFSTADEVRVRDERRGDQLDVYVYDQ
jgi:hypothetical protein